MEILPHDVAGSIIMPGTPEMAAKMREVRRGKRAERAQKLADIHFYPEGDKALSEADLEKRARLYVPGMLRTLYDIALNEKVDAEVRVKAADVVLQRALGRPTLRSVVTKRKDTPPRSGDRPMPRLVDIVKAREDALRAQQGKGA